MTCSRLLAWLMLLVAAFVTAGGDAAAGPCIAPPSADLTIRLLRDVPLITAAIDGKPATLLFDTGAQDTVLSAPAAARLGLAAHYEYPRHLGAVGGGSGSGVAATRNFAVGPFDEPGFQVMVGAVSPPEIEGIQPDGLLGADFLADFAVDLDLPDQRLTLHRPQCPAREPAWPPPFATIAANRSLHDHLFFPVLLDGRQFYAFIDTGAARSVIDRNAALALGITPTELAEEPAATLRGAAAGTVGARLHRFSRLQLGDILVRDPLLGVIPLGLDDADIILGEDFIEPRRIWLSYAPPQVFIKGQ
jgi:predicted aspartyl protease